MKKQHKIYICCTSALQVEQVILQLVTRYRLRSQTVLNDFQTGFPAGDEVLHRLTIRIKQLLLNYPTKKLAVFLAVLSEVIRYAFQSLVQPRDFFPHLYNSKISDEKTFHKHLYEKLTAGARAVYYHFEESDVIGRGRLDITYRENEMTFPIEVKIVEQPPTWDTIQSDFIAQIQTYTHPYNQIGILVVFDISTKKDGGPVNNFKNLFEILSLKPYYRIANRYPDYVVAIIIPANKLKPSDYTTYN